MTLMPTVLIKASLFPVARLIVFIHRQYLVQMGGVSESFRKLSTLEVQELFSVEDTVMVPQNIKRDVKSDKKKVI